MDQPDPSQGQQAPPDTAPTQLALPAGQQDATVGQAQPGEEPKDQAQQPQASAASTSDSKCTTVGGAQPQSGHVSGAVAPD
eukprot:1763135-Lingulodinium_polyedra.AAC.1